MFNSVPTITRHFEFTSRRRFLSALLGFGVGSVSSVARPETGQSNEWYLSAALESNRSYSLRWIRESTAFSTPIDINYRGHSAIQHPNNPHLTVLFARRPATECIVVDIKLGEVVHRFQSKKDRHFYGHGVFSHDGQYLFTTENDLSTGKGVIAIRDAQNFQWLGEYYAYGIGPHEIKRLPNSTTLVLALGGILTHPDSGRKKLNLDSMESSLAYIDSESGQLLDRFRIPETKASIRHLDVAEDGTVVFAMQLQRDATRHHKIVALGGVQKPGQGIALFDHPEAILSRMKDYTGSVAINSYNDTVGYTSPRGNIAVFWRVSDRQFLAYHVFSDVCGIAVNKDQSRFILSGSRGQIRQLNARTLQEIREDRIVLRNVHWDNHLALALF